MSVGASIRSKGTPLTDGVDTSLSNLIPWLRSEIGRLAMRAFSIRKSRSRLVRVELIDLGSRSPNSIPGIALNVAILGLVLTNLRRFR